MAYDHHYDLSMTSPVLSLVLSSFEGGVTQQPAKCFQFTVEISDPLSMCRIGYAAFIIAAWPLSDSEVEGGA